MTAVAPAWAELLSAALVGTERRPLPSGAVGEVAALVGADLPAGDDEHRLLTAAGVVAIYRRCGFPVAHDEHPPAITSAAADERPPAPAPAVQILELLLTGQVLVAGGPGGLVRHWLDQCVAMGYRLPGRTLPALLDWGTRAPDLREPLLAAGGPALVWLAGHNDLWTWAPRVAEADEDTWRLGDHRTRFALLRRLRAADPAKALALAYETWSGEKAGDRAEIVEALSTGRADADEPFLEAALDDRAASVRTAAAAQLAARPSSGLAQRMAGRLRPLVSDGAVEPPRELDEAARRDGVVDRGAPRGVGLRAWWLKQMVAAAPLEFWGDPAKVIPTLDQAEVRDGWALAAVRQRNSRWAAELLRRRTRSARDDDLLRVLPPDEAHALLRRLLGTRPDADLAPLLGAAPAPWPRSLTEAALARISQARAKATFIACLPHLVAADPAMAEEVGEWLDQIPAGNAERRQINQLVQALSIRHAIARAFSGD